MIYVLLNLTVKLYYGYNIDKRNVRLEDRTGIFGTTIGEDGEMPQS